MRLAVYLRTAHTCIMDEQAVEHNSVASYSARMKKLLKHLRNAWYFLYDLGKPKPHWAEVAFAAYLKEMQREHALEAEMDAALLAALAEEAVLTEGRPVTLLAPSRTIH